MAPPDVIDVASRPVRAAERTPTLRRKKSFPKVKVNSSRYIINKKRGFSFLLIYGISHCYWPFKKRILLLGNKGDCDSPPLCVLYQSQRGACHLAKICFAARDIFLKGFFQRLTICSHQEPLVLDVDFSL
nr:hypothetical protein [Nicotiana tabacum]